MFFKFKLFVVGLPVLGVQEHDYAGAAGPALVPDAAPTLDHDYATYIQRGTIHAFTN